MDTLYPVFAGILEFPSVIAIGGEWTQGGLTGRKDLQGVYAVEHGTR